MIGHKGHPEVEGTMGQLDDGIHLVEDVADVALLRPGQLERLALVTAYAADLRHLGPANFLYADGEVLFAHGHRRIQSVSGKIEPPGLFMLSRQCCRESEGFEAQGVSVAGGYQEVVLLASVPLSDESWRPLQEGEVVAISLGKLVNSHQPTN